MAQRLVAVTGGSGFIGARLCRRLRADGHAVRCLDIKDGGNPDFAPVNVLHAPIPTAALAGAAVVIHLAGPVVDHVRRQPYSTIDLQVRGTLNVLDACRRASAAVILASSFYVYSGIPEDAVVNECTALDLLAVDPFGAAKLMAERAVMLHGDAYGLPWSTLRFGSAYGRGQCSNIVQSFLQAGEAGESFPIWGRGRRRNQYTYVEDIVDGIVRALDARGVYNLISPEATSTAELAALFAELYGFEAVFDEDRADPPSMPYMVSRRAEEELGWRPRPLREGIVATYEERSDGSGESAVLG